MSDSEPLYQLCSCRIMFYSGRELHNPPGCLCQDRCQCAVQVADSSCCSARDLEIPHFWLTGFLDNQLVVLIVSTATPLTTVHTNEWLHILTVIFINWFTIIGFILWWIKVCCLVILMKYYFIQGNHFKTSHIYWNNSIKFIKIL